jgi:hypothetical protein
MKQLDPFTPSSVVDLCSKFYKIRDEEEELGLN